ncbi:MAG: hypothetical protein AMS17_04285 [Spirochaetes bacterium DG_61]|jgi:hypothetical protein|nr:MAG: hypothetical protein AMS17_04285 [Spirochaetes bacterium DG_61]
MDIDKIGEAAGEVWRALHNWHALSGIDEGMTIGRLKHATNVPDTLLHEALGWLAREGKIRFSGKGRSRRVFLI